MAEEIKDRLKALRKAIGEREKRKITQREIADKLGVKNNVVGGWEAGLQPVPDYRIDAICTKYNVRREWLETGVGEMFEEKGKVDLKDVDDKTIYYEAMERMFKSLPDEAKQAFKEFCDDLKSI